MEVLISNNELKAIDFAPATEIKEIIQNVKTILSTIKFSVPLMRDFGINASFVDLPVNAVKAKVTNEVFMAIKENEPRAEVKEIIFSNGIDGVVELKVRVNIIAATQ